MVVVFAVDGDHSSHGPDHGHGHGHGHGHDVLRLAQDSGESAAHGVRV